MILDYYRIFYYVAQYKSFSKAADVMGNNQPNITRCMNILENELGCKLFIRSNRGVQLTIEGERLFEHVSIAIEQLVSGENELLKDKGLESGLVNIGASEIALRFGTTVNALASRNHLTDPNLIYPGEILIIH